MALANYQDLLDATSSWLNREDQEVLDRIPDFVVMAENRIFRRLRTRDNEKHVQYLAANGDNTQSVQLPADFLEVKFLQYDGRALERRSDQYLLSRDPNSAGGQPLYYARLTDSLHFWRSADENSDVDLWYYYRQERIDAQTVPPLYASDPELYLWGALLEAEPFLKHKDRVPIWQGKYDQVFAQLEAASWEAEYAGSTVDVSSIYASPHRSTDGKNAFIR